jgi:uncharacterized membrane protein (DUF106 family)
MVLDSFFNGIFGWAINADPLWGLIFVSFVLTFLITLSYKFMTDQKLMKSVKEEMKDIRKQMKEFKDDPTKVMELQKRSMDKSMVQMKNSFKPMIITFIPLIIIFGWLRETYAELPIEFLWFSSWLWIYIIFSIIFSIFIRKLLKVH